MVTFVVALCPVEASTVKFKPSIDLTSSSAMAGDVGSVGLTSFLATTDDVGSVGLASMKDDVGSVSLAFSSATIEAGLASVSGTIEVGVGSLDLVDSSAIFFC